MYFLESLGFRVYGGEYFLRVFYWDAGIRGFGFLFWFLVWLVIIILYCLFVLVGVDVFELKVGFLV